MKNASLLLTITISLFANAALAELNHFDSTRGLSTIDKRMDQNEIKGILKSLNSVDRIFRIQNALDQEFVCGEIRPEIIHLKAEDSESIETDSSIKKITTYTVIVSDHCLPKEKRMVGYFVTYQAKVNKIQTLQKAGSHNYLASEPVFKLEKSSFESTSVMDSTN